MAGWGQPHKLAPVQSEPLIPTSRQSSLACQVGSRWLPLLACGSSSFANFVPKWAKPYRSKQCTVRVCSVYLLNRPTASPSQPVPVWLRQPSGARAILCQSGPFRPGDHFTYARGAGRSSPRPSSSSRTVWTRSGPVIILLGVVAWDPGARRPSPVRLTLALGQGITELSRRRSPDLQAQGFPSFDKTRKTPAPRRRSAQTSECTRLSSLVLAADGRPVPLSRRQGP